MELVRTILLAIEDAPLRCARKDLVALGNKSVVEHHLDLLEEAGFVEEERVHLTTSTVTLGFALTWQGHEFVESVRDPKIWAQTKGGANRVGSWTVSMISELAKGYVRLKASELGLPLG